MKVNTVESYWKKNYLFKWKIILSLECSRNRQHNNAFIPATFMYESIF